MKLGLEKSSGRAKCRNDLCEKKTEFINERGRIRHGTMCAWIQIDSASGYHTAYYCRDCISKIYGEMKKILNPDLWIFH